MRMRDIKFRYIAVTQSGHVHIAEFTIDELENGDARSFIEINVVESAKIYRCQFTGLLDKEGVEIFEGDIISDHVGVGVVVFDKWAAFAVSYGDGHAKWFFDYTIKGERESIEVIGNIYQHPELLK